MVDPFKDGADWLVVRLAGGLLELETEVCGDVLIGGRIGRVGVVVVDAGLLTNGEDELNVFVVDFVSVCTDVVDDGVPKGCPGEKADALGLSRDAEARSCHCPEAAAVDDGGVGTILRLTSDALLGNPEGALCDAAKMEDGGATNAAAAGVGDGDGAVEVLAKGDPK